LIFKKYCFDTIKNTVTFFLLPLKKVFFRVAGGPLFRCGWKSAMVNFSSTVGGPFSSFTLRNLLILQGRVFGDLKKVVPTILALILDWHYD
jgi:hypothetical protein